MKRLIFLLLAWLLGVSAFGANWYLDKAASGSNNGTSPTNAWQSAADAMAGYSAMSSNDTLLIMGGDYSTEQLDIYFPSKTGITFRIDPASVSPAIFKSSRLYQADGCSWIGSLNGQRYIRFVGQSNFNPAHQVVVELSSGFSIDGVECDGTAIPADQAFHGIHFNGTVSIGTVNDCYIHHFGGDGINANTNVTPTPGTYTNLVATNNVIYYVSGDGIKDSLGSCTITGNNVQNGGAPNLGEHPDGFQLNPDNRDVVVSGNYFSGFNQNIFIEYAVANIFIYNNVCVGGAVSGTDRAVNMSVRDSFSGTFLGANNDFYNFLTYSATNGGLTNGGGTIIWKNNIYVNCKLLANNGTEDDIIDNTNSYFNLPGVQYYDSDGNPVGIPVNQFIGAAVNNNPLWINAPTGNFHLTAGSPAIGTGTDLSAYFTTDADGLTRSVPWDIGAYKYVPPSSGLSGSARISGTASIK